MAAQARRLFQPSSWLGWKLTGEYYVDHHSASQCTPMYDAAALDWYEPWARMVAPDLDLPPLCWPGDVIGAVTAQAAAETGLAAGTPVIAGTIDAWSEAVSVGADRVGDLMLMYGTTMFLINTVAEPLNRADAVGHGRRPARHPEPRRRHGHLRRHHRPGCATCSGRRLSATCWPWPTRPGRGPTGC